MLRLYFLLYIILYDKLIVNNIIIIIIKYTADTDCSIGLIKDELELKKLVSCIILVYLYMSTTHNRYRII